MTDPGPLKIWGIILAAGESRRFGKDNKLLTEIEGIPMLERVVMAVTRSAVGKTIVVAGSDYEAISSLISGYDVELIKNDDWREGMGSSLAKGTGAVEENSCAGILVCLGDLPFLDPDSINKVINAFVENECNRIVVPSRGSSRGHPVVFPVSYFEQLVQLDGDHGAKVIIKRAAQDVTVLPVESSAHFEDIDTA